jgi:O-antigen/teichoic acid export membrane protein
MFFAFIKNTAVSLIAYALTTLLAIGINVVAARMLGPAGQGAFTLIVLFSTTVGLVVNAGLGQSAIYYFRQGTDSIQAIINNLAAMTLVIGIPTAVLLAIGLPWYGRLLLGNVPRELILAVAFLTPIVLGRMYAEYIFGALHDFVWYSGLNLIDLSVRLTLLLLLLGTGGGLRGAVIAVMLSTTLSTVIGWNVIRRRAGRVRLVIERALLRRFASYGVRSYGAVFITYLNLRFDQFLVGFFLTLRDVGIYSVAVIVAELTMKLANVVAKVLFANVSSLDSEAATKLTGRVIRATMTLAILTGFILAVSGPSLIRILFGPDFERADSALLLLLPGTILFNLTQVLYSDLSGRGMPEVGLKAGALSLMVTLAGNALLTPRWGINGAALTSTIAYAIGAGFILRHYLRAANQRLSNVFWVTRDDVRVIVRVLRRIFTTVRAPFAPGA